MNRALFRVVLAASTSLSVVTPALAQDAGDIVVTARRTEERLQDVPISITVFNQEQLANKNVTTGQDLVTYTPSLSSNSLFGTDNVTFAIRGFVQDIGTQPSVGVFFADVVAPRGGALGINSGDGAGAGSFFDLQNVQVLKGPQGTLFGRNTSGGDILLVPQKPTDKLEGYVEGSLGNYDMRRVQAVINVPVNDTLRVRLGVDRQKRDGWMKNGTQVVGYQDPGNPYADPAVPPSGPIYGKIGPNAFNDIDYTAVRASIVADLTPDLENYTIASYSHSDTNGSLNKIMACGNTGPDGLYPYSCAFVAPNFYETYNTLADAGSKVTQWQVINTTTWKASDALTVKNIVSYAERKQTLKSSVAGLGDLGFGALPYPVHVFMVYPGPNMPNSNQSTFTEELQFQGNAADGKLTWQAGAYAEISNPLGTYGNETAIGQACGDINDPTTCLLPYTEDAALNYTVGKNWYRNYGLYAQASYNLTEELKLTGGFRYTWDKQRSDAVLKTYLVGYTDPYVCTTLTADPLNDCRAHASVSASKPTWLIGLDYTPVQDVLLYAKYSRGFRAGGLKIDGPANYLTFNPEKIDTYEVGVKSSFNGAIRGTFNLSGFYNNFQNQLLLAGFVDNPTDLITVSPATVPVNIGKSRMYGLEADLSVTPVEGLNLTASYAYLNTKVKEARTIVTDPSDPYMVVGAVNRGDPLTLSPKHKLVLGASYTLPLDESIGKITLGVNYIYTDKQLVNYISRYYAAAYGGTDWSTMPSYSLLNANVNWNSVGGLPVDLAFFATNLTKKKYITFTQGLASYGAETGSVGEPRMYGVRLKYRFGE